MPSLLPKSHTQLALTLRKIPCWTKVIIEKLGPCWSEQIWHEVRWGSQVHDYLWGDLLPSVLTLTGMRSDSALIWPSPKTTLRVCSKLLAVTLDQSQTKSSLLRWSGGLPAQSESWGTRAHTAATPCPRCSLPCLYPEGTSSACRRHPSLGGSPAPWPHLLTLL